LNKGLFVGVVASDLAGSSQIVYKLKYSGILHYGEGGDVENVTRILIITSFICDWLAFDLLTLTLLFIVILYL